MRLTLTSKEDPDSYYIGDHRDIKNSVEYHRITFERYLQMPQELLDLKARMMEQAKTNENLAK